VNKTQLCEAYEKEIHLQASENPRRQYMAEGLNDLGFAAMQRLACRRQDADMR